MASETIWTCDVYCISDGHGNMKFGVAKNISSRMKCLQVGNAHPLQLLFSVRCWSGARYEVASVAHLVEHHIHRQLSSFRMTGEWFAVDYHHAQDQMEQSSDAISTHPWAVKHGVEIDGVFVEKSEHEHIWYWPTSDVHERGLA